MVELYHGDCLEIMKSISDKSIDMVLADPPYGTTECKWDSAIDLNAMWNHLKRIVSPGGAIVIFGAEIFSAELIISNRDMYKYTLIWEKSKVGRFAQAKGRFLNTHEDLIVFSDGGCSSNSKRKMKYYPQGLQPFGKIVKDSSHKNGHREGRAKLPDYFQEFTGYPKSILKFSSVSKTVHPTEKPVPLLEYLIKTYTIESETVLDFTMGSGSTGVACKNLNRKFIGIEKEEEYFKIAESRIRNGESRS